MATIIGEGLTFDDVLLVPQASSVLPHEVSLKTKLTKNIEINVPILSIIDWYSRRVLAWRLANTLEAGFCVDCLEDALRVHGRPAVFNTDQGSQFTSAAFTGVLLDAGIEISMDGRGRALDNIFVERLWRTVKYEDVYIKGYASLPELLLGLTEYFAIYNGERPHQSLGYRTPDDVYRSGDGGGARIVDRFGDSAPPAAAVREAA